MEALQVEEVCTTRESKVWTGLTHVYCDILNSLEEDGSRIISISSVTFLPRLFAGWNAHPIRTEGFLTPNQLWEHRMLDDVAGIQIDYMDWESSGLSHNSANTGVTVSEMECPLKKEDIDTLRLAIDPLSHSTNFERDII